MKRTIIIILVVGLIVGLGFIGFSTRVSAAPSSLPPQAQADTKLVTIAEGLTLAGGITGPDFVSEYMDVKSYRQFKLYVKMTPGPMPPPPPGPMNPPIPLPVRIMIGEHPTGDGAQYGNVAAYDTWNQFTVPPGQERYTIVGKFDGMYSQIMCSVANDGPSDVKVSIYLLMTKE